MLQKEKSSSVTITQKGANDTVVGDALLFVLENK